MKCNQNNSELQQKYSKCIVIIPFVICPADINGRARLADFGISRRLLSAGRGWMARETLTDEADIRHTRSTDIQVRFTVAQTILKSDRQILLSLLR